MIPGIPEIAKSLTSPGDWAVALAAGTIGLVVDGAINIAPIPFFSPGICGAVAASTAISMKKGIQAGLSARKERRRRSVLKKETLRLVGEFRSRGKDSFADDLAFELSLVEGDVAEMEALVREKRKQLNAAAATTLQAISTDFVFVQPDPGP